MKDKEIMVLINKHTNIHYRAFKEAGLNRVTRDDIQSEVSRAFVKALDSYILDAEASFETFAATVIRNAMIDFLRKESREAHRYCFVMDDTDTESTGFIRCQEPDTFTLQAFDILRLFSGAELVIAKEMISPSGKVTSALKAVQAKAKSGASFKHEFPVVAMSAVYNLPLNVVSYMVRKIRKKLKNNLDKWAWSR